ncbi:MAG: hypothetical protein HON65_09960 [Rhodospirillales bacterium]|nr:hypothetical protein [Rhodospirillales bacterium]
MRNLFLTALEYQRVTLVASMSAGKAMSDCYLRFLEQQSEIFKFSQSSRHTDAFKKQTRRPAGVCKRRNVRSPCTGADFHDHYGKRANDVNVDNI